MKVKTTFDPKPIPHRWFDWCAIDEDNYDGFGPMGFGETEEKAIADLKEQIGEEE